MFERIITHKCHQKLTLKSNSFEIEKKGEKGIEKKKNGSANTIEEEFV